MSTKHKPGTVATATVDGIEDVRVFRVGTSTKSDSGFWVANSPSRLTMPKDEQVTDIRLLVVLDADDARATLAALAAGAASAAHVSDANVLLPKLARQIEDQTNPRIPEPGPWGVVVAKTAKHREALEYVHTPHGWTRVGGNGGVMCDFVWESLIDPELLREGLS